MYNKSRLLVVIALMLFTGGLGYLVGSKVAKNEFKVWADKGLSYTQAMLAFNHLLRYEELSACLKNEQTEAAIYKLNMSIISEKELIADFLQSDDSEGLNNYISLRYPKGIGSLRNFKSSRGSSWSDHSSCKQ